MTMTTMHDDSTVLHVNYTTQNYFDNDALMTRTPWPTTPLIIPLVLMGITSTTYYDYDNDDDADDSYTSSPLVKKTMPPTILT